MGPEDLNSGSRRDRYLTGTGPAPRTDQLASDRVSGLLMFALFGTPEGGWRSSVTAHIVGQEIVVIAGGEGHGAR
jgi:hypothetical protein